MTPDEEIDNIEFPDYPRQVIVKEEVYPIPIPKINAKNVIQTTAIFDDPNLTICVGLCMVIDDDLKLHHYVSETEMPWFDPANLTDEEIKTKIENLLAFL